MNKPTRMSGRRNRGPFVGTGAWPDATAKDHKALAAGRAAHRLPIQAVLPRSVQPRTARRTRSITRMSKALDKTNQIAQNMRPEEIHPEVTQVLDAIAALLPQPLSETHD